MDILLVREIAETAGNELRKRWGREILTRTKQDDSLVTEADLASQEVICQLLRDHFPDDQILAEEGDTSFDFSQPGKPVWIVDPLDGTTNFAHGFDYFCVSIARATWDRLKSRWVTELGVVHAPVSERTFWAQKGAGAWLNERRLPCFKDRPPRPFSRCFLVTGFAYDQGDALERSVETFLKVASQCNSIRRPGAAALDLCHVAAGIFDAYWENGVKAWDVAAALCLIEELGGTIVNYAGDAYQYGEADIAAGRPEVVDTLVKLF